MSIETLTTSARDPRTVLVRDKYFSMRPQPLQDWLWRQALPAAAERVFWVHWDAGAQSGDWCSVLPLREVARRCHVDTSTISRAYQLLKRLELIRREEPGRDPNNPFRQAVAVTEVRVPRDLVVELSRSPNRRARDLEPTPTPAPAEAAELSRPEASPTSLATPEPESVARPARHYSGKEYRSMQAKLSAAEKAAFQAAWHAQQGSMTFDEASALSPEEQAAIRWQLRAVAQPPRADGPVATSEARATAASSPSKAYAGPRQLTALEAARLRRRLTDSVAPGNLADAFREVLWSVEQGALRRFAIALAVNIALKKIREGAWTRPNRMPPNWLRGEGGNRASPETCVAA